MGVSTGPAVTSVKPLHDSGPPFFPEGPSTISSRFSRFPLLLYLPPRESMTPARCHARFLTPLSCWFLSDGVCPFSSKAQAQTGTGPQGIKPGVLPLTSLTHPGYATRASELPGGPRSTAAGVSMHTPLLLLQQQRKGKEEAEQGGTKCTALRGGVPKSVCKIGVFHSSDRLEEVGHVGALGTFGNLCNDGGKLVCSVRRCNEEETKYYNTEKYFQAGWKGQRFAYCSKIDEILEKCLKMMESAS